MESGKITPFLQGVIHLLYKSLHVGSRDLRCLRTNCELNPESLSRNPRGINQDFLQQQEWLYFPSFLSACPEGNRTSAASSRRSSIPLRQLRDLFIIEAAAARSKCTRRKNGSDGSRQGRCSLGKLPGVRVQSWWFLWLGKDLQVILSNHFW